MGKLTNLNPLTEADIPQPIARDTEVADAIANHEAATDPHLQYATQARGDARYIQKYSQYFKAALPSSVAMQASLISKINFPTAILNVGNQFANSRITALTTEVWRITTFVTWEVSTISRVVLYVYKNGVESSRLFDGVVNPGFFGQNITPSDISLNQGNYLEIYGIVYSASKIYGDLNYNATWWEGRRVA